MKAQPPMITWLRALVSLYRFPPQEKNKYVSNSTAVASTGSKCITNKVHDAKKQNQTKGFPKPHRLVSLAVYPVQKP